MFSKFWPLLVPFLIVLYAISEYYGWLDKLTQRDKAIEGLHRLQAATGFPQGWIYNDKIDQKIFNALEKRISKNTHEKKVKDVLKEGIKPSLIVTSGSPFQISGVHPEWPQESKNYYSNNHPIMYAFGIQRLSQENNKAQKGKVEKVCTLGELSKWIENEKNTRKFILESICIGILTIAVILLKKEP